MALHTSARLKGFLGELTFELHLTECWASRKMGKSWGAEKAVPANVPSTSGGRGHRAGPAGRSMEWTRRAPSDPFYFISRLPHHPCGTESLRGDAHVQSGAAHPPPPRPGDAARAGRWGVSAE